jgi:hypothetical protein
MGTPADDLRALAKLAGFRSLAQLTRVARITRPSLRHALRGERALDAGAVAKLAATLRVTGDDLLAILAPRGQS